MSSDLENSLTRTLTAAAEHAPKPPLDLLHRVEVRHRRRRRRRTVMAAGLAVLVVTAGSMAVGHNLRWGPRPPAPTVVAVPAAMPEHELPAADAWPQAVRTISANLADGRGYHPITLIDHNRLLVSTEASFEKADELWVIDLTAQQAHRLARIPEPRPDTDTFASHFTVGSGHVVWWTSYRKDGREYTDIWKVPVAGGEPSMVVTVPDRFGMTSFSGDRLAVANDTVYWSKSAHQRGEHAVWRVPLAGGKPEKVPGTDGHHIVSLPWVGKPGEETVCPPGRDECQYSPSRIALYTELRNIDTGERRTAVVTAGEGVMCGVTYCFELGSVRRYGLVRVRHRDGSHERTLSGWDQIREAGMAGGLLPGLDRFLVLVTGGEYVLYDLRTDRQVSLGPVSGSNPPGTWLPENPLLFWPVNGGKAYVVVDLAAIP